MDKTKEQLLIENEYLRFLLKNVLEISDDVYCNYGYTNEVVKLTRALHSCKCLSGEPADEELFDSVILTILENNLDVELYYKKIHLNL